MQDFGEIGQVFTIPPRTDTPFKYVRGALRLGGWIEACQRCMAAEDHPREMGLPYGIIKQRQPEL